MAHEVAPQEINAQLARLRAADLFASSPQLVSFLDYVAEETLAGRGAGLKGYTIAVEALGRPADFDPQMDPIVRVEARRLRQALKAYYAGPGRDDPIIIAMPTGGYLLEARRRPTSEAAAEAAAPPPAAPQNIESVPLAAHPPIVEAPEKPLRPSPAPAFVQTLLADQRRLRVAAAAFVGALFLIGVVAVDLQRAPPPTARMIAGHGADEAALRLPIVSVQAFSSGDSAADHAMGLRMAESLAVMLSRFDEVRVLGPAARKASQDTGDYLLRGHVSPKAGGGYSLSVAMLAPVNREVLFARDFPSFVLSNTPAAAEETTETEALQSLAIELAQPNGFLSADQTARLAADANSQHNCLHLANMYWREPTEALHARARACLKAASPRAIPESLSYAHLAFLALDEHRNNYPRDGDSNPLDRALAYANAAVAAGPTSARAEQAVMDVLFLRGQTQAALEAGERALKLNPLDMDILADLGSKQAAAGQLAEGREKLLRAAAMTRVAPAWLNFQLVLTALMSGDHAFAQTRAAAISSDGDALNLIARLLAARQRGAFDQAEEFGRKLAAIDNRYQSNPRAMISRRPLSRSAVDFIVTAIEDTLNKNGS